MTPSLSKTITAEAGPEWAKSKSRDGSFHGRVRAQRFQSSIIAALSARVASRAFIGPLPQKATLADFPNVGKGSDSVGTMYDRARPLFLRYRKEQRQCRVVVRLMLMRYFVPSPA